MKNIYYGFIFLFFIIIAAPAWGLFFQNEKQANSENRTLTVLPKFGFDRIRPFFSELKRYISDHHAFRGNIYQVYMSFTLKLNESPMPIDVVIGENSWYYLGNKYNYVYNESLGLVIPKDKIIEQRCRDVQQMKAFCDSLGIGFYFTIAPNKASVYPEHLPLTPNKRQRFKSIFTKRLKDSYNINAIDLGEYIYPKKDSTLLYYRNDSHWNNYGSWLATQKLVDVISHDYKIDRLNKEDFHITPILAKDNGDIVSMLKLKADDDDDYEIERKKPLIIEEKSTESDSYIFVNYTKNNSATLKSIVYRDSFFATMMPLFSMTVNQATFIQSNHFDRQVVIEEIEKMGKKPDFIVFEIVERYLPIFSYK